MAKKHKERDAYAKRVRKGFSLKELIGGEEYPEVGTFEEQKLRHEYWERNEHPLHKTLREGGEERLRLEQENAELLRETRQLQRDLDGYKQNEESNITDISTAKPIIRAV